MLWKLRPCHVHDPTNYILLVYISCCILFPAIKCSPNSITERGVPELIPVLGSQPAGDMSHKPGGEAAITFRQARSYPRNP